MATTRLIAVGGRVSDGHAIKVFDSNGQLQWEAMPYEAYETDFYVRSLVADTEGNLYVGGDYHYDVTEAAYYQIKKFNSSGELQWLCTIPSTIANVTGMLIYQGSLYAKAGLRLARIDPADGTILANVSTGGTDGPVFVLGDGKIYAIAYFSYSGSSHYWIRGYEPDDLTPTDSEYGEGTPKGLDLGTSNPYSSWPTVWSSMEYVVPTALRTIELNHYPNNNWTENRYYQILYAVTSEYNYNVNNFDNVIERQVDLTPLSYRYVKSITLADDSFYVCGYNSSNNAATSDNFSKYSASGSVAWRAPASGNVEDFIIDSADESAIFVSQRRAIVSGESDYGNLRKYNVDGEEQWAFDTGSHAYRVAFLDIESNEMTADFPMLEIVPGIVVDLVVADRPVLEVVLAEPIDMCSTAAALASLMPILRGVGVTAPSGILDAEAGWPELEGIAGGALQAEPTLPLIEIALDTIFAASGTLIAPHPLFEISALVGTVASFLGVAESPLGLGWAGGQGEGIAAMPLFEGGVTVAVVAEFEGLVSGLPQLTGVVIVQSNGVFDAWTPLPVLESSIWVGAVGQLDGLGLWPIFEGTGFGVEGAAQSSLTLAVNSATGTITQWSIPDATHWVSAHGKLYGLHDGTLMFMDGATDDGTAIPAQVRLAPVLSETGTKFRTSNCYLGSRSQDALQLTVIADEIQSYTYSVLAHRDGSWGTRRIKIGRGVEFFSAGLLVENMDGGELDLTAVELLMNPLSRKI